MVVFPYFLIYIRKKDPDRPDERRPVKIFFYLLIYNRRNMEEKKKEEENEEELLEINMEIDLQPWTDEEIQRVLEMEKKGGLTKEEREWCRRWCCGD